MRQHLLQLHGAGELTPALMFPTWASGGLGIRTCPKFQWRATARAPIDDSSGFRKLGRRFRRKMSAATWRNPYLMLPTWVGGLGLHACHIGKYSTKTPKNKSLINKSAKPTKSRPSSKFLHVRRILCGMKKLAGIAPHMKKYLAATSYSWSTQPTPLPSLYCRRTI